MLSVILLAMLAAPASGVAAQKPKLAVLDLSPGSGVDASVTQPLSEALTSEVQRRGFFDPISQRDIQTMLGLERQRQMMGCSDDNSSCLAELSGALGARFVLSGTVARLGDAYQLTLTTLDTQKAQPLGRATRLAKDLGTLQATLPYALSEATATPSPAPPSRAASFSLIGVGSAAAVFGLAWGAVALGQQNQLQGELAAGEVNGQPRAGVLQDQASYQQRARAIVINEIIALASLGVGAALIVTGVVVMPKDVGSGAQVALVPTANGAALVGVFP